MAKCHTTHIQAVHKGTAGRCVGKGRLMHAWGNTRHMSCPGGMVGIGWEGWQGGGAGGGRGQAGGGVGWHSMAGGGGWGKGKAAQQNGRGWQAVVAGGAGRGRLNKCAGKAGKRAEGKGEGWCSGKMQVGVARKTKGRQGEQRRVAGRKAGMQEREHTRKAWVAGEAVLSRNNNNHPNHVLSCKTARQ